MGAWSVDAFGNDTACDFAADVAKVSSLAKIEAAFDRVLSAGDELVEAPDADEALAAADIVARLRGNFGLCNTDTEGIDQWAKTVKLVPSADLLDKARRAVDRVRKEPSESLELWAESDEFEAWKSSVEGLRQRLS